MQDYSIRKIKKSDSSLLLSWRNSERIRSFMFSDHIITPEEHAAWLDKMLKEGDRIAFIVECEGRPIGVVNFTDINQDEHSCSWGFYIGDSKAPKGSGFQLGLLALDQAFQNMGINTIHGEVMEFNSASIKFHQKLGFKSDGVRDIPTIKNGKKTTVFKFYLTKKEWEKGKGLLITQ